MLPSNAASLFAFNSAPYPALQTGRWSLTPSMVPLRVSGLRLLPLPLQSSHVPGAIMGAVGCSTYGEGNSLWLSQELERILSSQKRPGDGLVLTRGQWSWVLQDEDHYQLRGKMGFHNVTKQFEIFIPEVHGRMQLLASMALDSISTSIQILPWHPDGKPAPRADGYWPAYITRAGESTSIEVLVDIVSKEGKGLGQLQAARLEIEYISYGPHGRSTHVQHVVLPLQYLDVYPSNVQWHKIAAMPESSLLPIHTHLLSHLDDPLEVLRMCCPMLKLVM